MEKLEGLKIIHQRISFKLKLELVNSITNPSK